MSQNMRYWRNGGKSPKILRHLVTSSSVNWISPLLSRIGTHMSARLESSVCSFLCLFV